MPRIPVRSSLHASRTRHNWSASGVLVAEGEVHVGKTGRGVDAAEFAGALRPIHADLRRFAAVVGPAELERVDPESRGLLYLVEVEGATVTEAAGVIGCSPVAARAGSSRARRRLRAELERELLDG